MIELEDTKIEFRLGDSKVQFLKKLSFALNKGEFVSIMGRSGSGKSTLAFILRCLNVPTAVKYNGTREK